MKKAILSLYTDDKCNLNCSYCSVDYDTKTSITEKDVKDFIENNRANIDFNLIQLFGGEPTIIYSEEFMSYLCENFKKIYVTTNLKDITKLKLINEKYPDKLFISASYNEEVRGVFEKHIKELGNIIAKVSRVVTKDNIKTLYDDVKFFSSLEVDYFLEPEIDRNNIGYNIDNDLLRQQFQLIWDNHLEDKMINFDRIRNNYKTNQELCTSESLSITKTGLIESCSHACSFYKTNGHFSFGNIFDTKIKDIEIKYPEEEIISYDGTKCLDCKICHNYSCATRIYETKEHRIQEQVCEFNRVLYDFATNYVYKIDVKSLSVYMTEQCNLKCTYCFERDFKNSLGKVSNEIIKKAIDLLMFSNTGEEKKFSFFGGEPTLNTDGIEFAANYYHSLKESGYKNDLVFDITTNLYKISDKVVNAFKKVNEYAPLSITVSLDGFKELNDKQRIDIAGNPTYDTIIKNARVMNEKLFKGRVCHGYYLNFSKHTVITNESIKFIDKIVEEAWNTRDIFTNFSVAYVTSGKGEHTYLEYENLKYIKKYFDKILESDISNEKKEFIEEYLSPLNLTEYPLNTDGYAMCNAIEEVFSIRANGDILPCHAFFDEIESTNYSTEIKINNILDVDPSNFGLTIKSKWFPLVGDKNKNLNEKKLKIKSELGYDCELCPFKFMCHTCIAGLKDIIGNTLIKSEETCMRTLNQAEILLDIKKANAEKRLEELTKIENEKIDFLLNKIIEVGELVISNKNQIDNIIDCLEENSDEK